MNRPIALLSALLLGVAPIAALAQSQIQHQPPSTAPQSSGAPAAQQPMQNNQQPGPDDSDVGPNAQGNPGESKPGTAGALNPATAEKSPQQVQQVQEALNQSGEQVKVDGIWGPRTSQALRVFQQKNGLQPSGQLDDQTMQKLNIASGD